MNEVILKQENILQLNKGSLQTLGEQEANRLLEEGYHDAIELTIFGRKYVEFLTAFTKALKEEASDKLIQNGNKMDIMGSKVAIATGITYYDYEKDSTYANLKHQLDQRKELLKAALKQDGPVYDADGAEIMKVPIKRINPDSIKVTL